MEDMRELLEQPFLQKRSRDNLGFFFDSFRYPEETLIFSQLTKN